MRINFIEKPKAEQKAEQKSVSFLLNDSQMGSLYGGNSCGVYNWCGEKGKNSCQPFDCTNSRTDCSNTRTWVVEQQIEP